MERKFKDLCEKYGGCWHVYTPGNREDNIFKDEEDFILGMNLCGYYAGRFPDVAIFTFELMNNHHHFVLGGDKDRVYQFFDCYQTKLLKVLNTYKGYNLSPSQINIKEIDSYQQFRSNIVYTNRNGYVVNRAYTPFTYPWGANICFFNIELSGGKLLSSLPYRQKREMFRSHDVGCPPHYVMCGDYIYPASYCAAGEASGFFFSAHDYLAAVSRNVESYKEFALEMGDDVYLTDNEMYALVKKLARELYEVHSFGKLTREQKWELAKMMRYDYRSTNKQIARVLQFDEYTVDSMFPLTTRR